MTNPLDQKCLLLQNASIILPDSILKCGSVLLEGPTIKGISDSDRPDTSADYEEIDLSGLSVFPGFIDVHIHGAVGVDTMNATSSDLSRVSNFLATQGVTSWLPTLVPGSVGEYVQAVGAIDDAMSEGQRGARILGVHYEGPFVNLAQCGALHKQHFRSFQNGNELDDLPQLKSSSVSMMTLAPEVDGGIELIKRLTADRWISSIGHTRATEEVLNQALAVGAHHMTHFMNAMVPLHHRNPGPVSWGLTRDDVTCDIIADGVHLDPSILKLLLKVKGPSRLSLISDAIAAAGQGDGEYQIWGETIAVKDGRTSNAAGSIAGSVISMLDAIEMMRSLEVSDVEVAQMASTNPARLLKLDHECGSIEEGKRADLVVIDADAKVQLTVVGGEVVHRTH